MEQSTIILIVIIIVISVSISASIGLGIYYSSLNNTVTSNNLLGTVISTLPEDGTSVKCKTDGVYRVSNGKLRMYGSPMIASSWDPNWLNAPVLDCSQFQIGDPMALKL